MPKEEKLACTGRIEATRDLSYPAEIALVLSNVPSAAGLRAAQAAGVTISQFDVMPMLKDGQVWKGLLKADLTNMAAMLKSLVTPVGG